MEELNGNENDESMLIWILISLLLINVNVNGWNFYCIAFCLFVVGEIEI